MPFQSRGRQNLFQNLRPFFAGRYGFFVVIFMSAANWGLARPCGKVFQQTFSNILFNPPTATTRHWLGGCRQKTERERTKNIKKQHHNQQNIKIKKHWQDCLIQCFGQWIDKRRWEQCLRHFYFMARNGWLSRPNVFHTRRRQRVNHGYSKFQYLIHRQAGWPNRYVSARKFLTRGRYMYQSWARFWGAFWWRLIFWGCSMAKIIRDGQGKWFCRAFGPPIFSQKTAGFWIEDSHFNYGFQDVRVQKNKFWWYPHQPLHGRIFVPQWFCPCGQCHHQKMTKTITWLPLSRLQPTNYTLGSFPEPSGSCIRNIHQLTPKPSGTLRNLPPEPTPAHTGTPGTFRNLPPEPTPAHRKPLEPSSGTCSCDPRRHTHRSLCGLKTPLDHAVGEQLWSAQILNIFHLSFVQGNTQCWFMILHSISDMNLGVHAGFRTRLIFEYVLFDIVEAHLNISSWKAFGQQIH